MVQRLSLCWVDSASLVALSSASLRSKFSITKFLCSISYQSLALSCPQLPLCSSCSCKERMSSFESQCCSFSWVACKISWLFSPNNRSCSCTVCSSHWICCVEKSNCIFQFSFWWLALCCSKILCSYSWIVAWNFFNWKDKFCSSFFSELERKSATWISYLSSLMVLSFSAS